MVTLFQQIARFVNNMDARAITSLVVTLVLLGFLTVMMVFGTDWLGINQDAINEIMNKIAASPFALIGVIANALFVLVENRVLRWHHGSRGAGAG